MTSITRIAGVAIAVAFGAAACGNSPPSGTSSASSAAGGGSGSCPSSVSFTPSVSDHGAAPASGTSISLTAGDSFFQPTCTTGVAGGTVTLTVRNTGAQLHNVSVSDQGIDMDVAAGATINVQIKVGTTPLVFFCKYHRASGMLGALLPTGS